MCKKITEEQSERMSKGEYFYAELDECKCKELIKIADDAIKKAEILLDLVVDCGVTTREQAEEMREVNNKLKQRLEGAKQ